jgi:HEAT repeat protein
LGQRKVRAAVPAIGDLLDDPREQVVEAAAEALAEIGDEKAVPFLVKGMRRWDLRSEVRAIEAMGHIGGEEAEAYLEMTAIGHEVPEVRILSKSLLQKLSDRKMRERRAR